jgi:lipid A 3-O-deacylase
MLGFSFTSSYSFAGTSGGIYDMSIFLNERHPFAQKHSIFKPVANHIIKVAPNAETLIEKKILAPIIEKAPLYNYVTKNHNKRIKTLMSPITYAPEVNKKTLKKGRLVSPKVKNLSNKLISEIRVGALWHDQGPFSHRKERGYDGNLEILFTSPKFLTQIWTPRPHMGISLNSVGDTNQTYLGLTWESEFYQHYFANFSVGAGYHDGYKVTDLQDRKSLGCKFLFRESIDLGFRVQKNHSIMAHLDHVSNAKLCSTNEGLESVGIRYGYLF